MTHDNRILDVADRIVKMVDGYIESDIDIGESMTVVSFLQKCPVFEKASPMMLTDTAAKMQHEQVASGEDIILTFHVLLRLPPSKAIPAAFQ